MNSARNSGAEVGTIPLLAPSGWAVNRPRLAISARSQHSGRNSPVHRERQRQRASQPTRKTSPKSPGRHPTPAIRTGEAHRTLKWRGNDLHECPLAFFSRTALAHRSISVRMSASSLEVANCDFFLASTSRKRSTASLGPRRTDAQNVAIRRVLRFRDPGQEDALPPIVSPARIA
jgi:hypothetical protein